MDPLAASILILAALAIGLVVEVAAAKALADFVRRRIELAQSSHGTEI